MDCPALHEKTTTYPFGGKVPSKIKMRVDVVPDIPFHVSLLESLKWQAASEGETYDCWVNSHGAVCVVFPDGEKIGVKPHEFEVVEWHGGIIELRVDLKVDKAEALAQFCKRLTHLVFCEFAANRDEAYLMQEAMIDIAKSLANVGYQPR